MTRSASWPTGYGHGYDAAIRRVREQRRRWQRQPQFPGAQLHGEREPAADRVTRERDMAGGGSLIKQPPVRVRHVIDRHRELTLGQQVVADDQRPRTGRLRQVAEHLAMGVERTAHEPSAVDAHQHPVVARAFRHRPDRGQPAGLGLQVVDPAWFGREVSPRLVVGSVEPRLHHRQPG